MNSSNAAVELLSDNNILHPDKIAYLCGEQSLTYGELARACQCFALNLLGRGVAPGDRVLIALPDCFAFPVVFLGCLLSGAIAVAIDSDIGEDDFSFIVEDCGPRLLVVQENFKALCSITGDSFETIFCDDIGPLEEAGSAGTISNPYQPSDDDLAYMLYSSGSTGRPKGVPHRHKSLVLPCDLMGKALLGIKSEDVIFSTSKLSFAYGLVNSLAFPLRFGATAVLCPGKPDPRTIIDIIRHRRPSLFFSIPTIYSQIILNCPGRRMKLPMRLCCSAGEALPAAVFHEWQRLTGMEILDGLGCTEMSYHFISNIPGLAVPGSAGRLVPGYQARLIGDNGDIASPGSEGHLLVKGETMAPFYWNMPEKSTGTMLADGFMRTGDIFAERDGFFYHRGRSDDMIKTDARWVSPLPVENALRSHPAVADCAVAAVLIGSFARPGAFVVLKSGIDQTRGLAEELKSHLLACLPAYMCPVRFRFMDDLPRTSTGKVRRSALCVKIQRLIPYES